MFAIPGIIGLLFFIYIRPQEAITELQSIPFLYICFSLAVLGMAVDMRLRINKLVSLPHWTWAVAFYFWCVLSVAINAPDELLRTLLLFSITIFIFFVIGQSIQRFRVLEFVAFSIALLALFLAYVGADQGFAETVCIQLPEGKGASSGSIIGHPDGRTCETIFDCYENDPEPGADYWCQKPGLLGTHSVGGRVRYRGVLQDPNELALAIGAGLAFAIALWVRVRNLRKLLFLAVMVATAAICIYFTRSRSGQLVFLSTFGVFILWKFRWKAIVLGLPLAIPLLFIIASGGGRADASASTMERYEAWRTGLELFGTSPIWGVGQGQFTEYHHLTAHNTFILVLGELGLGGTFIFLTMLWVSIKTPLKGYFRYRNNPKTRVAEVWCIGMLAAFAAIFSGALFLSFAYHYILWIYMGLSAALFSCIQHHDPTFRVKVRVIDLVMIFLTIIGLYVAFDFFLLAKHV